MLQNIKRRTNSDKRGFTIIEVLIVLAIAGLILLIVFLAVPALQRNSRNNARKNDVARVGAAVNDYAANHDGTLPNEAQTLTMVTNLGNFGQFDPALAGPGGVGGGDRLGTVVGAQAVMVVVNARTFFRVVTSSQCNANNDGTAVLASNRQSAIQYQTETGNPNAPNQICLNI